MPSKLDMGLTTQNLPPSPAGAVMKGERSIDAKWQSDRPFEFLSGHPDIVEHMIIQPLHALQPPATAHGM